MAVEFTPLNANSINNINTNFERVDTALQDAVSRSGNNPNHMNADLDMNGHDILNVKTIQVEDITVDGGNIEGILERALEAVVVSELNAAASEAWAQSPSPIPPEYGGDGVSDLSAKTWAEAASSNVIPDSSITNIKLAPNAVTDVKVDANAAIQSSKLSYLAASQDAIARTVQSRLREILTLGDFGLPANNTGTDGNVAEALQRAVNELNRRNGGLLLIPNGIWRYTDVLPINLPSNTTIIFDPNAVIRCSLTGNASVFNFPRGTKNSHIIGRGRIQGPYFGITPVVTSAYPGGNIGVLFSGTADFPVEDCSVTDIEIAGWGTSGLFIENSLRGTFTGLHIHNCGRDGIRFYGGRWNKANTNHIHNIAPGISGNPGNENVYGLTYTRRANPANLVTSADLNLTTWTTGNAAVSTSGLDPYGLTAYLVTENAGSANHLVRKTTAGIDVNRDVSASILFKAGTRSQIRLQFRNADLMADAIFAFFNSDGSVGPTFVGGSATLIRAFATVLPGGWVRANIIGRIATAAATNPEFTVHTSDTDNTLTPGGGTILVSGPQVMPYEPATAGSVDIPYISRIANPPPSRSTAIGNLIYDCRTWKCLDTHGGEDLVFADNILSDAFIAIGIDEGDTSGGTEDSPAKNITIRGNQCYKGNGAVGGAGINASSSSGSVLGQNLIIEGNLFDGFGSLSFGAVSINFQNNCTIQNNTLLNSSHFGIRFPSATSTNVLIEGNTTRQINNCVAAVSVESATSTVAITSGTFQQMSGAMTVFSCATFTSGHLKAGDGFNFINSGGTVTIYAPSANARMTNTYSHRHQS